MEHMKGQVDAFEKALLQMDRLQATAIFEGCFSDALGVAVLEHLTIAALERIGTGWETGRLSLAQVYMSGIICEELMDTFVATQSGERKQRPRMAIAVLQDHHALGKRIVSSVLRASGYDVLDFGCGLSVEQIVEKTVQQPIDVLLISTLMLPSALQVKDVVAALRQRENSTKVIVGGAPFRMDNDLWRRVDADAHGRTATDVIPIIEALLEKGV